MFSFQTNLNSEVFECTSADFTHVVISDLVFKTCAEVSRLKKLELQATDSDEKKKYHDRQSALKKRLPAFIFQGTFTGSRRRQSDVILNGLVMVDFDNIEDPRGVYGKWKNEGLLEQLQIVLVHITPSGAGLRVVAKADISRGNLADNQMYIAGKLGLQPDGACKDASRISFAVPLDYILFHEDDLFTYDNKDYEATYGKTYRGGDSSATCDNAVRGNKHSGGAAAGGGGAPGGADSENPRLDVNVELPVDNDGEPVFKGVTYKSIVAEWWRQQGGEPVVGERNRKLHRLAAHLRYIVDNSASALARVMPSYGLSDAEMKQLCASAVKLKTYGGMPKALAKVLQALGLEERGGDGKDDTRDMEAEYRKRLDKLVMPPMLNAVMAGVPEDVRIGALLASLPMIYTLASRVTFTHFDGTETRMSGMTFIIGPAASGKSFILNLDKLIMEPVRMADKAGRKTEQEYRDSKELNKNKQKQMEKPHPVIRITPIQISNTMLALRMRDAVDSQDPSLHLHVYSCEAELATALRAQKGGSWIEKNDLYCKSFHNEYWGMDYANDQAINGEIQVNLNLVISGTEDAFDKLIPTSTVLSGLPTRLMYFAMPSAHYKMIAKSRKKINQTQEQLIKDTAYYLDQTRGHIDAQKLADAMYRWCERIAKRAELEEDEELDDLRKRTAIIGERAGIAYALIAQRERYEQGKNLVMDKNVLAFAEFVADYCLYSQYKKFAVRMKEQKRRVDETAGVKRQPMLLASIYNSLPKTFTVDDLSALRPGVNRNSLFQNLNRWKQKGLIESTEKKSFKKLITKV